MADEGTMTPPPPEAGKANGNGGRKRLVVLLVLAALASFGLWRYLEGRDKEETDDAFLEGRVVAVSSRVGGHVLSVKVRDNQEVKAGDLLLEIDPRPFELNLSRSRETLAVAKARAAAAARSTDYTRAATGAGEEEARKGIDRAAAARESAVAAANVAKTRVEGAKAQVEAASAAVSQVAAQELALEARSDLANADLKRYSELNAREFISAQQLDQARAAAKAAGAELEAVRAASRAAQAQASAAHAALATSEAALTQAEAAVREADQGVEQGKARLAQARTGDFQVAASRAQHEALLADVAAAEVAVKQAELDLSYTRIAATENGRVTKKSVEPGAFVSGGQALMALVTRDLWVVANYKETQLARVTPGQEATVRIDAFPGRVLKARVDSIQRGTGARFSLLPPENATGNYVKVVQRLPVKLVFPEGLPPDLAVGPGMSVVPQILVR